MSLVAEAPAPSVVVDKTRIEMIDRGAGRPILFLHAENGIEASSAVIDELAKGARVIAPTHPGYGRSELPKGMRSIDDLSYFYLDLLDQLDLRDLTVVGVSLGAWVAAEIAVKTTARLSRLVMANAVGVKVADRETRDMVDVYSLTDKELLEILYCDPEAGRRDYKTLPEAEALCRRAQPRGDGTLCLESVLPQSQAQKPLAPHSHPDPVPVGYARPHAQRGLWARLLCDDSRRAFRTDRARRPFPASGAAEGFCREGDGFRQQQMTTFG